MRAHHRDHAARGIGRGLERLGVPLHQRGLNVVAFRLAVQHPAHGVAVMGEIGMQPDETPIAGLVDAGDGVPGRRRRLAVDAQIALAAAFDHGVTHVDRDILALPAAQFPEMRGGEPGRGDAGLRRGGDAKRRRQLRLFAGQRDGIERGRLAAGQTSRDRPGFRGGFAWVIPSEDARLYHRRHHPRKQLHRHCEERKRRSNPHLLCRTMDCFAEPVIGRASRDPLARNDGWFQ